ncbi:MAG TPA: P-type conjugative transfer protein TrbL, partial [Burkholderiaceae bacterium]|nr:P-type conjugative transfer protein TrbL [Burkholderiaceae bacterium]
GLAAGGAALAAGGAAGLAARGGAAVLSGGGAAIRGGAAATGAASGAYLLGAMENTGRAGVAGGLGGVARAAGGGAVSPLRRAAGRAADRIESSFSEGRRASVAATGGSFSSDRSTASGVSSTTAGAAPDWATRMRRSGHLSHAVQTTAHAVRSGDGHGSGSSVNLSESERP